MMTPSWKQSGVRWLWLALVVVALDQLAKLAILDGLPYGGPGINVLPFFNIVHVYNTGAAFSFLADSAGWQRWLFALIAVVVSAVLVVWLKRLQAHEHWLALGLALVLGGALGNLFDRVVYGHVIDFILVHWQQRWYFPAFNLADSAITLGAILLALDMFKAQPSGATKDD